MKQNFEIYLSASGTNFVNVNNNGNVNNNNASNANGLRPIVLNCQTVALAPHGS